MIIIIIVRIRSHLAAIWVQEGAQQVMSLFDALHPADEDVDVGAGDGDGPDARGHDDDDDGGLADHEDGRGRGRARARGGGRARARSGGRARGYQLTELHRERLRTMAIRRWSREIRTNLQNSRMASQPSLEVVCAESFGTQAQPDRGGQRTTPGLVQRRNDHGRTVRVVKDVRKTRQRHDQRAMVSHVEATRESLSHWRIAADALILSAVEDDFNAWVRRPPDSNDKRLAELHSSWAQPPDPAAGLHPPHGDVEAGGPLRTKRRRIRGRNVHMPCLTIAQAVAMHAQNACKCRSAGQGVKSHA